MIIKQKIVAILIVLTLFVLIIELIRRRKLKEEFSWIWFLAGLIMIIFTVWYGLLEKLTFLIGSVTPASALVFFTFIFLTLVCLQFSINISVLTDKVKNLAQEIAMLKSRMKEKDRF